MAEWKRTGLETKANQKLNSGIQSDPDASGQWATADPDGGDLTFVPHGRLVLIQQHSLKKLRAMETAEGFAYFPP